jgi:copper oxidase (laccase) domain-containing protein
MITLMIHAHQPTIFKDSVIAAVSSVSDGNMKLGLGNDEAVVENRRQFLHAVQIPLEDTTLVGITYATDDFTKYRVVTSDDKGKGMQANMDEFVDALVVDQPGHALFLPLADCIGAVFYDEARHVLMVSHLGRHSVEVHGATRSVEYLKTHFQIDPSRLKVWLSPGVGKVTYPLHSRNGQSLREAIVDDLLQSGVALENVESEDIDTAVHDEYYSHSEFLKGNRTETGRFAIVAMMAVQGEPAS